MAAELTLAFLYTVGTKIKTVGGADKGWVQEEGRVLLTSSRARMHMGAIMTHVAAYMIGSAQVPSGGNLGESGP